MSGSGDLRYDRYSVNGSDEWMMRIGSAGAPAILFLPPLFEEMNRTRALIAALMRAMAGAGYECRLPDLPGTGESERALDACGWDEWRQAAMAAAGGVGEPPAAVVSLRGGCLLDDAAAAGCYVRIAPVEGSSLLRDLERASLAGGAEGGGYSPLPALAEALARAVPAPVRPLRSIRLASDPAEADAKVAGPALWRRSEPGMSAELARALAEHIKEHIGACAAS